MGDSRNGNAWTRALASARASAGACAGALLLLVGCGSEGPPPQVKAELPTLSGTATYDETVANTEVGVKGVSGSPRAASNSSGTNQFKVSLEALTGPYILRWNGVDRNDTQVSLYSLATKAGVTNVTPLTTLLTAQLLGQDPAAAYAAFGASGGPRTELVTDANLADAQAKVTAFLQDTFSLTVKSGTSSFITSAFTAAPGDAMFDTIKALDDKVIASGTTLAAVSAQIAAVTALCLRETITITIGGQQREFCPATKTANPEEVDSAIIDYVFMDLLNNTLTVKVRADEVLSGEYLTAAGSSFTCEAVACGGIAPGTLAEDFTRTLTFTNTDLAGTTTSAILSGSLLGAVPGIALPILPCDNNKYYVIFQDRTVVGDCVDAFDPLGFGGTLAFIQGAEPPRGHYPFSNSSSTHTNFPSVEIVTDANTAVLSVYFSQLDPDTFNTNLRYVCQGSACNGVTLGPLTEDNDILGPGMPVFVRDISFDNTILSEINEEGSATGKTATLEASFRTVYFADPSSIMRFPDLLDCVPGVDTVAVTTDVSGPFNFCTDPAGRSAVDAGNDDIALLMSDDAGSPIEVGLHAGAVTHVVYTNGQINQHYSCSADCTGVTVSAPAVDGTRSVSFDGTVLHEDQSFPLPGPRTVTLHSDDIVFPSL